MESISDPPPPPAGDEASSSQTTDVMLDKSFGDLAYHDIQKIEAHGAEARQCDIVGRLPLEIVILIFENLDFMDLLYLQKVSKAWKRLLSSRAVQHAVIQTLGPGLADVQDTTAFIRKRVRIEEAKFVSEMSFTPATKGNGWCMGASYSEGYFAWIDCTYRCVNVVNLWTGEFSLFATQDRRHFFDVEISSKIIVAIGQRMCHVWDIQTHEYTSFHVPHSLWDGRTLVCGTKVLLMDDGPHDQGYFIHWSFESRIDRTIPWKAPQSMRAIRSVIPDPIDDKFTVVYLDRCPDTDPKSTVREYLGGLTPSGLAIPILLDMDIDQKIAISLNAEVHIETFTLGNGEEDAAFRSTSDQIQRLSLRRNDEESSREYGPRFFSLEGDKKVVTHTMVYSGFGVNNFNFVSPSPGIFYVIDTRLMRETRAYKFWMQIMHSIKSSNGRIRDYEIYCEVPMEHRTEIYGDGDFIITVNPSDLKVQSFNKLEIWDPDQINWSEELLDLAPSEQEWDSEYLEQWKASLGLTSNEPDHEV